MTFILVDANNLFHRAKHVVHGDADMKGGMALHIILNSLGKIWRMFDGTHVVIALEGGRRTDGWRYKQFSAYKAHRAVQAMEKSNREKEDDAIYFEYMNEFIKFVLERTNCTVLRAPGCEADDCIARWTQLHSDEKHVILSSDTDFYQLLSPTVQIYNGINSETINLDGFFDDNGNYVINKKTGKPKIALDPKWELFKKCLLGDKSDGVFRAVAPRIREIKLRNAYDDREGKGFAWNNLMLNAWIDHDEKDLRVIERYKHNKKLIDLTLQPEEVKLILDQAILTAIQTDKKSNVGVWFMKFCHAYSLTRIEQNPDRYVRFLNAAYGE